MVSFQEALPEKCSRCLKSHRSLVHHTCHLCRGMGFQEAVLCDLNRKGQDPAHFKCYAFRPLLKIAGIPAQKYLDSSDGFQAGFQGGSFKELAASERSKYLRTVARQKLERNPDGEFMSLRYHLAWNVRCRKPVFTPDSSMRDVLDNILSSFSGLAGGVVRLLRLAPDHIHVYVVSDGKDSVEAVVGEMKRLSAATVWAEFSALKNDLDEENHLWDTAYFAETLG